MKRGLLVIFCFFSFNFGWSSPQYYCTAANSPYFKLLINLIGSIHKSNYDSLGEIAVFDLGLNEEEREALKKISKVQVYSIKEENAHLLKNFSVPTQTKNYLGWYTWKPVVIKEALEMFPSVLWIDAGSVVLKPLDDLFSYIQTNDYFLATSGDELKPNDSKNYMHSVGWGATKFVRKQFSLEESKNSPILDNDHVMAGIIGVTRGSLPLFSQYWYGLTKDIRFFEDDGTAPGGWGCCRYEQTLLSVLSYSKNLKVHTTDYTQVFPANIGEHNKKTPLYITWNREFVNDKTCIYVQSAFWEFEKHLASIKLK